jgi:hypothetical protein
MRACSTIPALALPLGPDNTADKLQGPRRRAIADLVSFIRLFGRPSLPER